MTNKYVNLAESYYNAMRNKDLEGMGKHFHPEIHFLGPLAELKGKEPVLNAVKNLLPLCQSLTIRAKFGSDDQAMLAYDLECLPPIGVLRIAALLTFTDNLISRMEIFFDARPFAQK